MIPSTCLFCLLWCNVSLFIIFFILFEGGGVIPHYYYHLILVHFSWVFFLLLMSRNQIIFCNIISIKSWGKLACNERALQIVQTIRHCKHLTALQSTWQHSPALHQDTSHTKRQWKCTDLLTILLTVFTLIFIHVHSLVQLLAYAYITCWIT